MRNYVYDNGKRMLINLTCDYHNCENSIKPYKDIAKSGWIKKGTWELKQTFEIEVFEFNYCPKHA